MAVAIEPAGAAVVEQVSAHRGILLRSFWIILVFFCSLLLAYLLRMGAYAYPAFGLAGSLVIHWQERRRAREMAAAVLLGAVYAAAYALLGGSFQPYVGWQIGTAAGFAGLGSIGLLCIRAAQARGTEQQQICGTLMRASFVPALSIASLLAICIGIKLAPRTWDYTLFAFDRMLGIDTFALGRLFAGSRLLFNSGAIVYNTLPLFLTVTLIVTRLQGRWRPAKLMILALGAAGFLAYQICPAAGPAYRFPSLFPNVAPVAALPVGPAELPDVYRNAMPSLHVGFALLCYWNLASARLCWRMGAAAYLVLTAVATMGCGEHYFVDLVVSVPLALAVYSACSFGAARNRRSVITAFSAVTTLFWLFALRTDIMLSSRALGWAAVFATLVGGFAMERALRIRAQDSGLGGFATKRSGGNP